MDDFGFFGKAFDFNFDGELDSFERAADFATFMSLINEANTLDDGSCGTETDDFDFNFDTF